MLVQECVFCVMSEIGRGCLWGFLTRGKEIVPQNQAQYNNGDCEKSIGNEQHDGHADSQPEQDEP